MVKKAQTFASYYSKVSQVGSDHIYQQVHLMAERRRVKEGCPPDPFRALSFENDHLNHPFPPSAADGVSASSRVGNPHIHLARGTSMCVTWLLLCQ